MTNSLIQTVDLKKSYEHENGNIDLFSNVNIKIKRGDLVALVGPSGSGKSSFLHLLGLLDEPNKGKILFNNKDMKYLDDEQKNEIRRKKISIIFQDNNLLTDFTAIENVIMPLIIRGENKTSSITKAHKILKAVKIQNRVNHFPNELSGGEQQRACVARAIIKAPDIILADEPTGNLDPVTSFELIKLLEEINKEGTSILMASHNYNLIKGRGHRIIEIQDGTVRRS